ncbi:MAG TPA: TIGR03620 family F420-dependent LLM class oxidoreductase [Solirubrobacteraceae bacterium]|nr:TIGR03620 family F420-dependent LLM class oxidoreductase [Solirubrobacteraceae bacterium]
MTDIGRVGVWSRELRFHADRAAAADAAAELEELGFGALFIPDVGGDVLGAVEEMLAATRTIPVVTGILNIWMHEPEAIAAGVEEIERRHPGRFLVGLGASHESVVNADGVDRYARPLSAMRAYLDALDAAPTPLPPRRRVLAALGPRMLELSRERSAGAHPYLVPPEHTAIARAALGPERLLAPELSVTLEPCPALARERARAFLADYLQMPNYVNNLRRLGYSDDDLAGAGGDRLLGDLVATGEAAVAAAVAAHHEAGADHVCVQVVGAGEALPRDQWRRLAQALLG